MMKIKSILLIILAMIANSAQAIVVIEDFADKDLKNNPEWAGDTASMKIYKGELRVATPNSNGYSSVYTKSDVLKNGGTWMAWFYIGTTPTASNHTIFVLSSETDDMSAPKGYFVKVGGSAKNICLLSNGGESLKGDNTTLKTLIKSEDKRVNATSVKVFIRVTRDSVGNWKLESKLAGESDYKTEGTAFDNTYTTSNYAGIGLGYTQSKYSSIGADNIRIFEKDSVMQQEEPDEIPLKPDSITTEDIYDAESTLKINEVMPDATKDETEEYIELINTTDREISLWQTWIAVRKKDGSLGTKYYFPYRMEHDFDRPKVRYVEPRGVVCVSEAPELDSTFYMSRNGSHFCRMDLPSLNNEGACIVIGSDDKTVHDEFCYNKSMFGDMIKNRKNVALERISVNKPSLDAANWKVASGVTNYGTPGYKNSNDQSAGGMERKHDTAGKFRENREANEGMGRFRQRHDHAVLRALVADKLRRQHHRPGADTSHRRGDAVQRHDTAVDDRKRMEQASERDTHCGDIQRHTPAVLRIPATFRLGCDSGLRIPVERLAVGFCLDALCQ